MRSTASLERRLVKVEQASFARRVADLERQAPPIARDVMWPHWLTADECVRLSQACDDRDDDFFEIEAVPYHARAEQRRAVIPYSLWEKIRTNMHGPHVPFDAPFDPIAEVRAHITERWLSMKGLALDLSALDIGELELIERIRDGAWYSRPRGSWRDVTGSTAAIAAVLARVILVPDGRPVEFTDLDLEPADRVGAFHGDLGAPTRA